MQFLGVMPSALTSIKLPPLLACSCRSRHVPSTDHDPQSCLSRLLDVGSNSVRHVLLQAAEEAASDDGTASERDRNEPDVLQRLGISPAAAVVTSSDDLRSDTWDLGQGVWRSEEGTDEGLGGGQWKTSGNSALDDVGGQAWGETIDEDVVAGKSG